MHSGPPAAFDTVVWDLGNVLVSWDPRRVFTTLLPDAESVERFLADVCTSAWNDLQDRGRSLADGTRALQRQHPQHAELIAAYYDRWPEMLGGEIAGSVALVDRLAAAGVRQLALSNWSAETFPVARARFGVLARFEAIVVSGEERVAKPDAAFFRVLVDRHGVDPAHAVFVDDNAGHVAAARRLGFTGIVFAGADDLAGRLAALGLPV